MCLRLRGLGDNLVWAFGLGRDKSTKSIVNLNGKKFDDFQHKKKYFDDFKQNAILRILDGHIQIIHDQKGRYYFPKSVEDKRIIKNNFRIFEIAGMKTPQNWTFHPVEIISGYCATNQFMSYTVWWT